MPQGLHIEDEMLLFRQGPKAEKGIARRCKSFSLRLEDVRLIAISPRLVLDDETLFFLIVSKEGKLFPMNEKTLRITGIQLLEERFKLVPIRELSKKFRYEDHYGKYDKVIYPNEHFWEDLFKQDWRLVLRQIYSWAIPTSFFGHINEKYLR